MRADPGTLTAEVTRVLDVQRLCVASAESCTGGRIAAELTALSGSSRWFDCGCVVYSNAAKMRLLGVDENGLCEHGAVSRWTVEAMCSGLLACSTADLVVASSGIAGPDGGSDEKPVGTVCLAWQRRGAQPVSICSWYPGNREQVVAQTVSAALQGLLKMANGDPERRSDESSG